MHNIKYCKATINEIENIKSFIINIIETDFGYSINPDWHYDVINFEKVYFNENSSVYIATDDSNSIIGTIASRPLDKILTFPNLFNSKNTSSIWRHYVKKNYRRMGIGTKLLKYIESFALEQNFNYIYLHTQKTIEGSLNYWLKNNYEIICDQNDEWKTVHLYKAI